MHDLDRIQLESDAGAADEDSEWGEPAAEGFTEQEVDELAAELVTVADEDELERFIGGLLRRAAQRGGRALRSDVGRALGGVVKSAVTGAARRGLPQLGRAVGGAVGGRLGSSAAGARLGERLASSALSRAGLGELADEFVDPDAELEVARGLVRFSGVAAQRAAQAPPGVDPRRVALAAAAAAARRGRRDTGQRPPSAALGGKRSGRWTRRGRTIVLSDV